MALIAAGASGAAGAIPAGPPGAARPSAHVATAVRLMAAPALPGRPHAQLTGIEVPRRAWPWTADPHTPRQIGAALLHHYHWRHWQFRYLNRLWNHESGWNRYAKNPYSAAYGIPQADPGSMMATAGHGWRWNARVQIRWGMRYIRERYGSPYWAWQHECAYNWY